MKKTIIDNKYIPHTPYAKQATFLMLPHEEAFYGGAAGGGKSDALLMAALQFVDIPEYTALLLRRTFPDLTQPDAIMDRADKWLRPTDARPKGSKTWVFPSGARLVFGFMLHEKDKYQYQSAQYDFIGFDETTQFTDSQFRYLFSRLRKLVDSPVPFVRMRSASNPGNIGHKWVKQRYIVEGMHRGRPFIPARLEDNAYLNTEDYNRQLSKLDPVTREQLRWGNWDISIAGNFFERDSLIMLDKAPGNMLSIRYWDFAATEKSLLSGDPDWTVGALCGFTDNYTFVIQDIVRVRVKPSELERLVAQTALKDGKEIPIFIEEEGGASGKITIDHYVRKVLLGYNVRGARQTKDKVTRAMPMSGYAGNGNVCYLQGRWNTDMLDELVMFPSEDKDMHDDQVDAITACFNELVDIIEKAEGVIVTDNSISISPV